MKKLLCSLLLICPLMVNAHTADDPFANGSWYLNDNSLNTQAHSPIPGNYDHSLQYRLPDGTNSATDECYLKSTTQLACSTGDVVTLDESNHYVTLVSKYGTYKFYDKDYPPQGSPVSGSWRPISGLECGGISDMDIPLQENPEATTFNNITIYFYPNGVESGVTYYIGTNPGDNSLYLGENPNNIYMGMIYTLLDANKKPINSMSNIEQLQYLMMQNSFCTAIYAK